MEDAYDFSLYELDGKGDGVFTLSTLLGRPVWLNFFASWCPPCNAEAANIVRIAGKYGDALCIVGVDVKEQPDKARGFRDLHKITYPIVLDDKGSVSKALGFHALPTHVFLDARGAITCISEGDLTTDQMDNEVAVALAHAPIPRPQQATPASNNTVAPG